MFIYVDIDDENLAKPFLTLFGLEESKKPVVSLLVSNNDIYGCISLNNLGYWCDLLLCLPNRSPHLIMEWAQNICWNQNQHEAILKYYLLFCLF